MAAPTWVTWGPNRAIRPWSTWHSCLVVIFGPANRLENRLPPLVDQTGEQLLGIAEYHGPSHDLSGRVEIGKTRDELTTHQQQPEHCGQCPSWQLEDSGPGGYRCGRA